MTTTIVPRDLDVDLEQVPRYWHTNNVVATAISNGLNMLFPAGERFFVRSVKHFLDDIDDPVLRAQIKGFFGQEGRHARAHDLYNDVLRAQGYEVDRFLGVYQRITTWLEKRLPPKLNLAATAAAEHYTAIVAEGAFTQEVFDEIDPTMRRLLAWHAAEEIEHKAVAFDVLQKIDPSYALRIAGLVWASVTLVSFWIAGTAMLLRQDRMNLRDTAESLRAIGKRDPIMQRVFLRGIRQYIRPDFHPNDNHNEHLAAEWFAARGISLPEAA
jgi:predicted metal-dependent hydrolase